MTLLNLFLAHGVVALTLGIATAALLFILAASIGGPDRPSPALPLVSAIVQTLSCVAWGFLIWRQFRLGARFQIRGKQGLEKRAFLLYLGIGVIPVVIAAMCTGAALGWSQSKLTMDHIQVFGLPGASFLAIAFVVWGITLALQAFHLISTGWLQKPQARSPQQRFSIGEGLSANEAASQQMTKVSRPETADTARTAQSNPFRETPSSSSPPTLIPSEGPSSVRSSFSTLQRPSSSKRSLMIRSPSFGLKHSRQSSSEIRQSSSEGPSRRPSQDEGFDSWDTSQVSFQIREALRATGPPPMKETRLTPIPGSRSPSPAKALEGPFCDETPSEDTPPMSPLPQPSVSRPGSPPSSPPVVPNFTKVFPASTPPSSPPPSKSPAGLGLKLMTPFPLGAPSTAGSSLTNSPVYSIMRNSSRSLSRQPSEDHIHPLFRTTSPSPAPSPSLGTVVTAAPEAGQLMDERVLRSRMRKGSLPATPSPLVRSESSPDMREDARDFQPLSAIYAGGESPPALPRKSPARMHQRKRSASLETFVKTSNNV